MVARAALVVSVSSTALVVLMDRYSQNELHVATVALASAAYVVMLWAERKWADRRSVSWRPRRSCRSSWRSA